MDERFSNFESVGRTKAVFVEKNYLGLFQIAKAVVVVRRFDFGECSVEMRMISLLGVDSMLSASMAEVGHVDIGCVGSIAMRCVPGFDLLVSGSVSSVDSTAMG